MIKIFESKLLIVDDDDLMCETLSDIFQEKGCNIAIAKNGREAFDKMEQSTYDIAIIDIRLPDMDGMLLLSEFKKIYPEIICIIITGYATLQNASNALKDGADGYFLKPLILEELVQRAQDVLEKRDLQRKLKESEKKYREAYNRADFYKDLFAHDINNILQSILSGMQLNKEYLNMPEKLGDLKENYKIIEEQILRGARLVSNVRKLSKLEDTQILNKKIEICNILEKSITYIKDSYKERNINVQIDSVGKILYVTANDFIEDLFENIIINAIKHNRNPLVEIIIKISREQENNINFLKIEFLDNGKGIPDSRKKQIFQRGNSEKRSVHGMGLGLSLVKKIVDTYKGEIWVEDKIKGDHSKGSNFVLLIPEVV